MLKNLLSILFSFFLSVIYIQTCAQAKVDTLKPGKRLNIIFAERMNLQTIDSNNQFMSLAGNVKAFQEKTFFYADSAVLNQKQNILESFGKVHINDADSVHTYADYIKY